MALDAATTKFLAEMARAGNPPVHEMTPQAARARSDALAGLVGVAPEMHRVEEHDVVAADGHTVPVRVLVPTGRPRGIFVYYHGGGWVVGSLDGYDALGRHLARRTGCAVALVDYRLAPEHVFPAAAEDAWEALEWAAAYRGDVAPGGSPIIVGGDSAGGNLAAVVAQRAARAGGPEIALQVLVYPVTNDDFGNASYVDPENSCMLTRESMEWFWNLYVPEAEDRTRWQAAPLKGDVVGVAPAAVAVAEHDVLFAEGRDYAEALRAAGVPVRERIFEGQMHGFFQFVNILPGAAAGMDFVVDAVEDVLAGRPLT